MRKVLFLSFFGTLTSNVLLHENLGVSLEKTENIYIERKKPLRAQVLVPLTLHVPEGPLQAETLARMQTEMKKVIEDTGVQNFHKNNTEKEYSCDKIREVECEETWSKAKNGKFKEKFCFLKIFSSVY